MAERTCKWTGQSGTTYTYQIYDIGTTFTATPANYIFAKETKPRTWEAVYIGQTGNLSERFDDHHKMPCIRRNGATHIHAHKSSGDESIRLAEETDLVRYNQPVCND